MDLSSNKFKGVLPAKYLENLKSMIGAHTNKLEYLGSGGSYYEDSVTISIKGNFLELKKIQTMIITIDFSRNGFTGGIPKSIGKLDSLKGLNLSHNKLSGPIPPSLGDLNNLGALDISSNELDRNIPQPLASSLHQLSFLNLSVDKFFGKIPLGKQFDTFGKDSYVGNLGLYGFPLDDGENPENENKDGQSGNEKLTWKLWALIGYEAGLGIGVSVGYAVFFSRRFDRWLCQKIGGRRQYCKSVAEVIKQRK